MTLTPPQWTLAFATALATHALAAALLPQTLSKDSSDPPPPQPMRVSLVTPPAPVVTPPAPVIPTPVVTPPTPARPTPPMVRRSEPEAPPTPKVVEPPPQPAPVPVPVKEAPLARQSVGAINGSPVATPQGLPRESTAPVSGDNNSPETKEEPLSNVTTAAAPTPVLDAVYLAQLKSQYVQTATHWLNKHKHYPRRAEYHGYEGTVLVSFVVSRHGEILDYKIKRSSGNILLDKEALATIRRTQSLPVFPDELVEAWDTITEGFEHVPIVVPIKFQLQQKSR